MGKTYKGRDKERLKKKYLKEQIFREKRRIKDERKTEDKHDDSRTRRDSYLFSE